MHVFSPDDDTPTGQVADVEIQAAYEDLDAVAGFARCVDVITFEFENVPVATADAVARYAPIHPAGQVLHTTQNRLREKNFLGDAGLPVTPFAPIRSVADIEEAAEAVGLPAVLKTASWGYDGEGQMRVGSVDEVRRAWQQLGSADAVLERWVDFAGEISVVAARGLRGELSCFEPISNIHRNHILDLSISPAEVSSQVSSAAVEIARSVLRKLDLVGVLCVQFFVTRTDDLLINELAPRPRNSGHLTIDAHVTCQFEQQVRAVCGLPLGAAEQLRPAAMTNLLGEMWTNGEPTWREAYNLSEVKLHLYGKRDARPGRKMGHVTALARSSEDAAELALEARRRLTRTAEPSAADQT